MSFVFKVWFFVLLILELVRVLFFVFRVYSAFFFVSFAGGGGVVVWICVGC